ncbi:hypothetical protein ACOSQ3_022760 [Xanthoceras sorbifolium]
MEVRPPQGEVAEASTSGCMEVRLPQEEIRGTIIVVQRSEVEKIKLCKELEATRRKVQAYKEEFTARTELENELAEKLEMNASIAKYKDQIYVLKDEIERAKADL